MHNRLFISYSHLDAELVIPVVDLLRETDAFVFIDSQNIRPGTKWRMELSAALKESNIVVVFWSQHSNASAEVEREYQEAIRAKKDILPVLLDSTPLPFDLTEYQWIDFRKLARKQREYAKKEEAQMPIPESKKQHQASTRKFSIDNPLGMVIFICIVGFIIFLWNKIQLSESSKAIVIMILTFLGWGLLGSTTNKSKSEIDKHSARYYENQMSERLQDVLFRRLNIKQNR